MCTTLPENVHYFHQQFVRMTECRPCKNFLPSFSGKKICRWISTLLKKALPPHSYHRIGLIKIQQVLPKRQTYQTTRPWKKTNMNESIALIKKHKFYLKYSPIAFVASLFKKTQKNNAILLIVVFLQQHSRFFKKKKATSNS